jgi:hypothetical protein
MQIKERTAALAREVLRRGVGTQKRYWPSDCKKRDVQIPKGGSIEMPTELADRFERHLRSKTPAGRLILALEAQ